MGVLYNRGFVGQLQSFYTLDWGKALPLIDPRDGDMLDNFREQLGLLPKLKIRTGRAMHECYRGMMDG